MKDKLALLLTVHNRKQKTMQCLRNISEQRYDKEKYIVDIFLTDDGCIDGTKEAIKQEFPEVHIIDGDGCLFWNRGMIAAWKEAAKGDYDYYLWLNDDTFIYEDAIERLLATSGKYQDKAIIVGSTCAVGNSKVITYGGRHGNKLVENVDGNVKCNSMNGNIVLVPRTVYLELGTLDPKYRHSLGDFDYGLMATKKGIDIYTGVGIFGECDSHDRPALWMDSSQPFSKRRKNFYSPIGNNPFEFFYFRRKHYGVIPACMTFISNYVHFLLPGLWKKS